MRKLVIHSVMMVLAVVTMTSCINTKKLILLKNMDENTSYPIGALQDLKVQMDDRLSIFVTSKNAELATPFNQTGQTLSIDETGQLRNAAGSRGGNDRGGIQAGYLVDREGYIQFPILGRMKVAGLTRKETSELIQNELINQGYISDPIVYVEIQNLRVTMMGEVNSQGSQSVTNARITLLEAISRAGGMTANADLQNVEVIREEGGVRNMYRLDVESTDIFQSPAFYLQQNDIVYVHPKFPPSTVKEERTLRFYSIAVGMFSFIASLFVLFK
ncbi:MAG: polysaccharide biosynthesis/export family protein [Mediterranea sp.]|jgi:polysaccharide export outer membrane protein|nr:polysaccharide biosynthesis/export family protein [Mediterranea sp.]